MVYVAVFRKHRILSTLTSKINLFIAEGSQNWPIITIRGILHTQLPRLNLKIYISQCI